MFNISKELKEKFAAMVAGFCPQLQLAKDAMIHQMNRCNPCSGCGNNCTGSCAGSCRGNCTGSCQRYSR